METRVIEEQPAFELRAGCGYDNQGQDFVAVSWAELRSAAVGTEWVAQYRGNTCRATENESATVVYRDERGAAVLHRRWGFSDSPEPWEFAESWLIWYEWQ